MDAVELVPIGSVVGGRMQPDDDGWGAESATIRLDAEQYAVDSIQGLVDFSHIEVVFVFDRVDSAGVHTGARHPRGRADWPAVGIFAQRASNRPNRLGVSRCRLVGVDGLDVRVQGLDAIDGTPVLDLKPWLDEFAPRGETRQPPWSHELMAGYYDSAAGPGPHCS